MIKHAHDVSLRNGALLNSEILEKLPSYTISETKNISALRIFN